MISKNEEFLMLWLYQRNELAQDFIQEKFSEHAIDPENGIYGLYGQKIDAPDTPNCVALLFLKAKNWTKERIDEWVRNHPTYLPQSFQEAMRKYPRLVAQRLRDTRWKLLLTVGDPRFKRLKEGRNPLLELAERRQGKRKIKGTLTPLAGMVVRTKPLAKPPKVKKPPAPVVRLLPRKDAGFGAYVTRYAVFRLDGTAIDRAGFDAMIKRREKC